MFVKIIPIRGSLDPIASVYKWADCKEELARRAAREAELRRQLALNAAEMKGLESEIAELEP